MKTTREMQESIIGALLINGRGYIERMTEADVALFDSNERRMVEAILAQKTDNVCAIQVKNAMGIEAFDRFGGLARLTRIWDSGLRSTNIEFYIEELRAARARAEAYAELQAAQDAVAAGDLDAYDHLEAAQQKLDLMTSDTELKTIDLLEAFNTPDVDPDWLIPGWLAKGDRVIVGGEPGFGKSYITLDLALALTTGGRWLGHTPAQTCSVTIVDEENSIVQNKARLRRLMHGRYLEEDEVKKMQLSIIAEERLHDPAVMMARMRRRFKKHGAPDVLIFDALVRLLGGKDENYSGDMAAWFASHMDPFAREFGCTVIVLHHMRKPPQGENGAQGNQSKFNLRGSGDIAGWPDSIWTGIIQESGKRILEMPKSRHLINTDELAMQLDLVRDGQREKLSAFEQQRTVYDDVRRMIAQSGMMGIERSELVQGVMDKTGQDKKSAGVTVTRSIGKLERQGLVDKQKNGHTIRVRWTGKEPA